MIHDGEVTRLVGFGRDVTEREQRERELERYRTIVETVPDPIYVLDADGCVTMANQALADDVGGDREELLGSHVSEFIPAEGVRRGNQAIRETLQTRGRSAGSFQMQVPLADGETRTVETHFSLLMEEGEFHGTVGILRDTGEGHNALP